jgi:hypothetical protein
MSDRLSEHLSDSVRPCRAIRSPAHGECPLSGSQGCTAEESSLPVAKALVALLALALLAVACEEEGQPWTDESVAVELSEFSVTGKSLDAASGPVAFCVKNTGRLAHQLLVIDTPLDPAELPVQDDGSVDESLLDTVLEIDPEELASQYSGDCPIVDLVRGNYALICNLVSIDGGEAISHYKRGMHATLLVYD